MKSLKLFSTATLACLFVVACAKSNETPASLAKGGNKTTQGTGNSTDGTIAERGGTREPLKLDLNTTTYTGETVVLAAKDAKNTGLIRILGDDASALMERLRLKEEDISTSDSAKMIAKNGKGVQCIRYESQNTQACYIYIDYRTGNLLAERADIKVDEQAKEITTSYTSPDKDGIKKLSILAGGESSSILSIGGMDAEAIYQSLNIEAKDASITDSWLNSKEKVGGNIRCTENVANGKTSQTTFACSIVFSAVDGSVKAATASPITKTEDKKEDTSTDDNSGGTTTPETPETPATVDPVTGAAK